jgi:signal transduction histidine kinase
MVEPENQLFRRLEPGTALAREQQRLKALSELGLIEAQTIPVFEEATQTAAYLLDSPICILGFLDQNRYWFKSAVGLSRLGLMNQLAQERQLARNESFSAHVVENQQVLAIADTLNNPTFAKKMLVQRYGIRAYLGVPLLSAVGHCLGAISVMDLEPRTFTIRDIKFLELIARWSMSEFERNRLLKTQDANTAQEAVATLERASQQILSPVRVAPTSSQPDPFSTIQVKLELLAQLTQELRTPLTSVLGMAGVVSREIYGPLTSKQKEYLEIIQNSGRYLLSLVNEISELGVLDDSNQSLNLTSVDIEMLCQQAINTLEEAANRREQEIRLSVEPGRSRIWFLDKDKVRQLLYHLVFSVIQSASTGSVIRIHVSHKDDELNVTVSVSHPWLGDGLTQVDPYFFQLLTPADSNYSETAPNDPQRQEAGATTIPGQSDQSGLSAASLSNLRSSAISSQLTQPHNFNRSHESLRLLLSCYLAELHGGTIFIQGTRESGYRYVVSLPELTVEQESL